MAWNAPAGRFLDRKIEVLEGDRLKSLSILAAFHLPYAPDMHREKRKPPKMVVFIEWRGAGLNRRPRAYESTVFTQETQLQRIDNSEGEFARLMCCDCTLDLNIFRVPCFYLNMIIPIIL